MWSQCYSVSWHPYFICQPSISIGCNKYDLWKTAASRFSFWFQDVRTFYKRSGRRLAFKVGGTQQRWSWVGGKLCWAGEAQSHLSSCCSSLGAGGSVGTCPDSSYSSFCGGWRSWESTPGQTKGKWERQGKSSCKRQSLVSEYLVYVSHLHKISITIGLWPRPSDLGLEYGTIDILVLWWLWYYSLAVS